MWFTIKFINIRQCEVTFEYFFIDRFVVSFSLVLLYISVSLTILEIHKSQKQQLSIVIYLFMAFASESFLYGSLRVICLFMTVDRKSRVLRHLIVIYISSHRPFRSRLFFIPHWSASTDLSVTARVFCFWFLMDCASTRARVRRPQIRRDA